jgi:hypothetical protein
MTPAPSVGAQLHQKAARLTRDVPAIGAASMSTMDTWGGGVADVSFTASAPMLTMGNNKAAAQTYSAAALFNSPKG